MKNQEKTTIYKFHFNSLYRIILEYSKLCQKMEYFSMITISNHITTPGETMVNFTEKEANINIFIKSIV